MSSELVEVGKYFSEFEAETIRALLVDNGIEATVSGGNADAMLSFGSALGGVKVFVTRADADRAHELLCEEDEDKPLGRWRCGHCGEEVESGFDVCWNCEAPRDETAEPLPDDPVPLSERSLGEQLSELDIDPPVNDEERAAEANLLLTRAYRSAIFGTVFLPIIIHLYAFSLLYRAIDIAPHGSDLNRRRLWLTVFFLFFTGVFWMLIFSGGRLPFLDDGF